MTEGHTLTRSKFFCATKDFFTKEQVTFLSSIISCSIQRASRSLATTNNQQAFEWIEPKNGRILISAILRVLGLNHIF
jgi:hypothetical protein